MMLMGLVSTFFVCAEGTVEVKFANSGFEQANKDNSFYAWSKSAEVCFDEPHEGDVCARQISSGSNWDVIMHNGLIHAEPKTRYRLTVWNRNTLTSGSAKYGIRLVDAKMETMGYAVKGGYIWRSVKKGESKWTEYKMDFTTPAGVKFVNVYFLVSNPQGDVFWDSVKLEKIVP